MMGSHLIKSWATSQPVVALSSGETELYALVKAAAQAKGHSSLLGDFGYVAGIDVHTDSTAALGIAHRRGLGRLATLKYNIFGCKTMSIENPLQ